jgi:hypothetical protein
MDKFFVLAQDVAASGALFVPVLAAVTVLT